MEVEVVRRQEVEEEKEGCDTVAKPPAKIKGEARISCGISSMGGSGSFNSAIILAMSSLETCLVLSRITEEGRVVTRIGVLGLRLSRQGNGVVGAGVGAEDRDTSGKLKLTASS